MKFLILAPLVFGASFVLAAPIESLPTGGASDYTKVFLALAFIVGLIFACAWLMRRMSGGVGLNQKHIQVVSVMPLGTREKLMIIRAADEYLLIGVTPNGIQTLHQFDGPVDAYTGTKSSPFADRLKGLLKGSDRDSLASQQGATTEAIKSKDEQ